MVATELNQHGTQGTIILQPNRSFSWRDNVWFLVGISGLSLMIGLMFLLQGFWLILPFGVLEHTRSQDLRASPHLSNRERDR